MRLERLSTANFAAYEALTAHGDDGKSCYCSFWHLKCSMAEHDALKQENPLQLRDMVHQRVKAGFHVGVIASDGDEPVAWVSVGPVPEFYWAWKRAATLGAPRAATTAAILCLTLAPRHRGHGRQRDVARALLDYGRSVGWTAIEAYPFDDEAVRNKPGRLSWPGFEQPYVDAGFVRTEPHWLSTPPEYGRWICRAEVR